MQKHSAETLGLGEEQKGATEARRGIAEQRRAEAKPSSAQIGLAKEKQGQDMHYKGLK